VREIIGPGGDDSLRGHPAYVAYWFVRITASFGWQMLSVAAGWQIYALTDDPFQLGLMGLVQFVPSVVLALPAGHMADQFERRHIVLLGLIGEWLALTTLAVLTLLHQAHQLGILALVFVISVCKAFESPSMQSILPALVPPSALPRAMAANASAGQTAMILGPALGGFLYVAGPGAVYAACAVLYLVAVILMARLRYEHAPPRREPATWQTVFAGVSFIKNRPDVLGVLSLDLFAVLLGGATALLPIFAKDVLHTGPWGFGLLRAAPAVGALVMSLWLSRYTLQKNVGKTMYAAVAGFGIATIVFALSKQLWLSLLALVLMGAFDMISVVIRSALVQLDTPDEMRGRVNAVNAIFINTSNQLGEFESGMMAGWLGAVPATLVGGVGTLVVVGVWLVLFPTLRVRQRLQGDD